MIAFPGQTGFSVTNIKYAKRWYEFYNQNDIIRQRLVDEFEMSADYGMVPRVLPRLDLRLLAAIPLRCIIRY